MTTKPHPTDAMEMPKPPEHPYRDGPLIGRSIEAYVLWSNQLRAERIKAYDLALEEAAKHFSAKGYGREMFIGEIEDELRSLKS